ncbi:MAG: Na+/H+ antiporter NhaA, partial [Bacteroidota bacterium]|jgi:NhaA family Na+:H+ antiporter
MAAAGTLLILYFFNRFGVRSLWAYGTVGLLLWYLIHLSGIHATVAGVLLAMMIPYDAQTASDPLQRLEQLLHLPVGRLILPLFALVNTALLLDSDPVTALSSFAGTGIIVGLVLGKPLGILSAVYISVRTGLSRLPGDLNYRLLLGAGLLGGIGFTMSIFIALLAFSDPSYIEQAKVAILSASALAGLGGFIYLNRVLPRT